MIEVRWTGTAALEFTIDGQTILIDPYPSRVSKLDVFFRPLNPDITAIQDYLKDLPGKLSGIIVGHTHFDHALDIPEFSKHLDGPLVGSQSLETLMRLNNMPDRVTIPEGKKAVKLSDNAAVTMIPATHGKVIFGRIPYPGDIDPSAKLPLKAKEYTHGSVYMPKLEIDGTTFFHAGSAGFIEKELEGHECDVLFICLPGWKKAPGFTSRFVKNLKPEVIIPFHFDNFTVPISKNGETPSFPFQGMEGFLEELAQNAPDADIRIPKPFEVMTF